MISLILAIDKNNLVGDTNSKNGLPWYYPEDLKYYKEMTVNKKNIMGRETYEQIGFPLPGRDTYVLSKNENLKYEGVIVVNSVEEILNLDNPKEEIMVAGGIQIFELLRPYASCIYVTKILEEHTGDVYYNNFTTEEYELESSKLSSCGNLRFEKWKKKQSH